MDINDLIEVTKKMHYEGIKFSKIKNIIFALLGQEAIKRGKEKKPEEILY